MTARMTTLSSRAALTAVAFAAVLLWGCAPKSTRHVSGTDEEQMEQHTSQLEELKSRPLPEAGQCKRRCSHAKDVCGVSASICEIAGRHTDRSDLQARCVGSQEDCARFNDGCASCG
jgi:hypothetical protein